MPSASVHHYDFQEKIGSGGMGEVFKAHDKRLNRFVAIKVLPRGQSGDPERRRRFIQEAQAASALSHPNIITIHDIFDEGETYYIVMEYVAGKTLHELIPAMGLRVAQVLQYAAQMADALSTAHAAGIVHRDLKPANVMVTASGRVKILDFGLAKLTDPSSMMNMTAAAGATVAGIPGRMEDQATVTSVPLTMEGSILGTVNYMSPEQAEGKRVDARSDIFSFGAVLYEMITGRRAFKGDSDISTLSAVLRDEATPISALAPDVPHELEDIVTGCLRKDPNLRWQSMKEVEMGLSGIKRRLDAGALHPRSVSPVSAAAAPAKVPAPVPRVAGGSRKMVLVGGAGVLALALVAAGAGWWWTKHRAPRPAPVAQVAAPAAAQPESAAPVAAPVPDVAPIPENPAAQPSVPAPRAANPAGPAGKSGPGAAGPAAGKSAPASTPRPVAPASANTTAQPSPPPAAREVPKPETPSAPAPLVQLNISDGLPFRIALAEDVPASAAEGQALSFRALDDLKVGDTVVIARGATVTGSIVSETGKKKFLGFGGKMTFQLTSAEGPDGQKLNVRAGVIRKADGPTARPLDTGKYAKSKELAAARGTDYLAYVDGAQTISVRK
ncbi:MAG TPA: protein kinase [Bryobacteraceae bacterium]|nr:protein kinase [Bryobacteraceae bacterium]